MFRKFLSPEGTSGGGSGTDPDPKDPPAPGNQNPPASGETAEQKLAAALKEAERWQNGYKGLQTTIAKKDVLIDDLTKQKDAEHSTLEALQATHTALQTEHEKAKNTLGELELGKNTSDVGLKRAKIIMKEFPQLAEWQADGQLPETPADAKDEDIRNLFKSFSDKLAAAAKINNKSAGGSPPPPAGGDGGNTGSAAEELRLANAAMFAGNTKEYNEHFAKYLELTKQKK
jgi:hypothetical protein